MGSTSPEHGQSMMSGEFKKRGNAQSDHLKSDSRLLVLVCISDYCGIGFTFRSFLEVHRMTKRDTKSFSLQGTPVRNLRERCLREMSRVHLASILKPDNGNQLQYLCISRCFFHGFLRVSLAATSIAEPNFIQET